MATQRGIFMITADGTIQLRSGLLFARKSGNAWDAVGVKTTLKNLIDFFILIRDFQEKKSINKVTIKKSIWSKLSSEDQLQLVRTYRQDLKNPIFTLGFFPSNLTAVEKERLLHFACLPTADRIDRTDRAEEKLIRDVFYDHHWHSYLNLDQETERNPTLFDYFFRYGPEGCYPSGLPKTRMSGLVPAVPWITEEQIEHYIPVIRYSSGATGSLFFQDQNPEKEYCGTFYYFEPHSGYGLAYASILAARNKYQMAEKLIVQLQAEQMQLGDEDDIEYMEQLIEELEIGRINVRSILLENGKKTDDPVLYQRDTIRLLEGYRGDWLDIGPDLRNESGRYISILYAIEDTLDQAICTAGYHMGYDILLLTHMAGSSRLVTEVLDTRSRADSLKNLFPLGGRPLLTLADIYPTPDDESEGESEGSDDEGS